MPDDPLIEYRTRLELRRAAHQRLTRADARFASARLGVFAAAALLAGLAYNTLASAWWLAAPAGAFVFLIVRHDRVIRARDAAGRAIAFYERGISRIEDRWQGTGEPGDRFRDERHLYANDLDLFGAGSLFELLSIARTGPGESTLAHWLKAPAVPGEIHARHDAVRELTPALDLRERLSLAGTTVRASVNGEALLAWAESPPLLSPPWMRMAARVVTVATVSSAALIAAGSITPFLIMLVLQIVFSLPLTRNITRVLHHADGPARDLDVLSQLLEQLEQAPFTSARLVALRRAIESDHVAASAAIRRLHRLIEMHDWQHNAIFAPVSMLFLWGTHLAWAIEAWRSHHGSRISKWLQAVGELEAFTSISAYRYEHPADPFPEITHSEDGERRPLFDGKALGHPLLPASRMVRNDVCLSADQRLLVVSGSNMSGKSTLLRTVGVNAVLAFAGAPVRGASLRISPLSLGATLRIQDSLQEGRSRFYAEITRIRELADLASRPVPLLFLFDELLQGTNSHDRLQGASAVLRGFIERGAIGLITTHDLALTRIADELAPLTRNVHFEDWFEHGEMRFDYKMKEGPVTRSNAIALMRAVGLIEGDGSQP